MNRGFQSSYRDWKSSTRSPVTGMESISQTRFGASSQKFPPLRSSQISRRTLKEKSMAWKTANETQRAAYIALLAIDDPDAEIETVRRWLEIMHHEARRELVTALFINLCREQASCTITCAEALIAAASALLKDAKVLARKEKIGRASWRER